MSPDRNSGGHQPSERRIGKFFGFAPGFRSRRARNHASLSSGAQEVAKLDLPKIPHHTAVFTEPVETTAFVFLPDRTRSFLSRDEYKGVRPAEIDAPGVSPGVIFLTADMKVPSEGSVKMLEFNWNRFTVKCISRRRSAGCRWEGFIKFWNHLIFRFMQ